MRNRSLHATLQAFTTDAASQLAAETASGAEIPFELVESEGRAGGRVPLYCYRPLTDSFITERSTLLAALPTYAPAAQALANLDGVKAYLRARGETRIPTDAREQADDALRIFLNVIFDERSEFEFDEARFNAAYVELENALYEGRCVTTVLAPLLGLSLDPGTPELPIGDGLSLVRGEKFPDAPADAVWGDSEEPSTLAVLSMSQDRGGPPPVSAARSRFRRILTALRLFERGGYAFGPLAWTRTDAGTWRPVPLGGSGRPRFVTLIRPEQEDELRAFCNLVARRTPNGGEVAWALARFEMGCERLAPFEALTDYLLALRALLEPEGPASGRLAGRLAMICATAEERPELTEGTAHAISLERAVVAGLAPAAPDADALVEQLADHLRALLRDVLCGHLPPDVRSLADELLEAATAVEA